MKKSSKVENKLVIKEVYTKPEIKGNVWLITKDNQDIVLTAEEISMLYRLSTFATNNNISDNLIKKAIKQYNHS